MGSLGGLYQRRTPPSPAALSEEIATIGVVLTKPHSLQYAGKPEVQIIKNATKTRFIFKVNMNKLKYKQLYLFLELF